MNILPHQFCIKTTERNKYKYQHLFWKSSQEVHGGSHPLDAVVKKQSHRLVGGSQLGNTAGRNSSRWAEWSVPGARLLWTQGGRRLQTPASNEPPRPKSPPKLHPGERAGSLNFWSTFREAFSLQTRLVSLAWGEKATRFCPPHGSASLLLVSTTTRWAGRVASPRGGPTQVTRLGCLYALGDARTFSTPLFNSLRALLQSRRENSAGGERSGADMDVPGENATTGRREGTRTPAATTRRKTPAVAAYALGILCLQGRWPNQYAYCTHTASAHFLSFTNS